MTTSRHQQHLSLGYAKNINSNIAVQSHIFTDTIKVYPKMKMFAQLNNH